MAKRGGKAYYMISAVAQKYTIHPQTLRLYEREGLLKPSRTEGNTRLYSEEDLEQLETILSLTRDLGVNLAGVEIILNMRRKMEQMQGEVNQFMEYVKHELARGLGDWEQRLSTAMVKSSPAELVRATPAPLEEPVPDADKKSSASGALDLFAIYNRSFPMACERCDDTGWKAEITGGVRRVVRCDCWREGATARALADARIPPRYRACELETFVIY